jgi:hypothetical protein
MIHKSSLFTAFLILSDRLSCRCTVVSVGAVTVEAIVVVLADLIIYPESISSNSNIFDRHDQERIYQ